ncbi:amino acid/amide ABC transporter substrate-binding protein (HAAT family) [Breoghania corrubedonensis]|uniref:Amino acid/amide ABC transporter substrate-binding protein (HAAT family) n=1 Tax=Breoghania corrubedonensis TaxID=665038 RepID=A0A2T5VCA3_9HYPH|nr:substrate-binding domain-containing protein [Breoghania corrubedonensis]PTW61364.1 amino acid/amide ABC transporter substrate-binding protein (HAAT family) [Breoghania corrubedonensis]
MPPFKIALLLEQEGACGLWAPSGVACTRLAVHELNHAGGVLGRETEAVIVNLGSGARQAVEATNFAIEVEQVDAIVGMFPSYARALVSEVIDRRVPYIYTPQFEGYEADQSVVTTGETTAELLAPALAWLSEYKRARRHFLCGSDYIWPRMSFAEARHAIRDNGGTVTGEYLMSIGDRDYGRLLNAIRQSHSDMVVSYFLGEEAIHFNRAFAEAGLAGKMLRFSTAIEETIVYGLGEDATENLYVSSAYFSSLRSRNNGAFLERYHTTFGETPPPVNGFGESCYEGVHCLASLVEEAGVAQASEIRRAIGRTVQQRTARGNHVSPVVGARQQVHLARVDGYDFTVVTSL